MDKELLERSLSEFLSYTGANFDGIRYNAADEDISDQSFRWAVVDLVQEIREALENEN